jgi:predicted TIM-barrel fold metal-dependent hydrolase
LLGAGATLLLAGGGAAIAFPRLARQPAPDGPLSPEAQALIDRAWEGLDPARAIDCHVHVVGLGTGGTGCFVNPRMTSWRHPIQRARFGIYVAATGIEHMARADQEYAARLLAHARWQKKRPRLVVLAFDQVHREDGTPAPDSSEFYVPNDYVLSLAREAPDVLLPAASIHPYRKDAVRELDRVAELGAVAVKWLPNAMLIDPSSPRCDPFYERLAALGLPLITHAGLEQAVEAEEAQKLGNPLLLRRALDAGVHVIVAHCASSGDGEDLDAGGDPKPHVPNFDLFLRMLEGGRWPRLYGDVSATVQFNRCDKLTALVQRTELHPRLVYGSDYPLPAINVLVRTGKLESLGLIDARQRALLNEIDRHDPLVFDFVLKRTVRAAGARFADEVFMSRPGLFAPT